MENGFEEYNADAERVTELFEQYDGLVKYTLGEQLHKMKQTRDILVKKLNQGIILHSSTEAIIRVLSEHYRIAYDARNEFLKKNIYEGLDDEQYPVYNTNAKNFYDMCKAYEYYAMHMESIKPWFENIAQELKIDESEFKWRIMPGESSIYLINTHTNEELEKYDMESDCDPRFL